jgi:hypothetical protein
MRKWLKGLAAAVLVTALAAPAAQATPRYNDIGFFVNRYASWTYESPYRVRHKTDPGAMWMMVGDVADGGVCVRLIDVHTHHVIPGMLGGADGVCWSPSQVGHRKVLSYTAPAGLDFAVQAKKGYPFGTDNWWSAKSPSGWFLY